MAIDKNNVWNPELRKLNGGGAARRACAYDDNIGFNSVRVRRRAQIT